VKISSSRFFILLFQIVLFLGLTAFGVAYGQNQTINGTLTVTGSTALNSILTVTGASTFSGLTATGLINSTNNLLTFGTQGAQGSSFGSAFQYADNSVPASSTTVDSMTFVVDRYPGSWLWEHNTSTTSSVSAPAMRLDSSHSLLIFPTGATLTTPALITMTPAASPLLSLGTATLTATGTALSTNGALTVGGNITNTTGSITGGATGLALNAGGTNQNVTLSPSGTGDIVFNAGGAERARIKSTGNVGIGTTNPVEKLDVIGNAQISQGAYLKFPHSLQSDVNDGKIGAGLFGAGLNIVGIKTDSTYRKLSIWGEITQQQNGTNTWGGNNYFTGNVGIGTATPMVKLDVSGAMQVSGSITQGWGDYTNYVQYPTPYTTSPSYFMGWKNVTSSRRLYIDNADPDPSVSDPSGGITFRTGGAATERMHISYGGNVGIGTTSPAAKLDVYGYTKFLTNNGYYGTRIGSIAGGDSYVWLGSRLGAPVIQGNNEAFSSVLPLALQVEGGNVGIGVAGPGAKLEVAGGPAMTNGWNRTVMLTDNFPGIVFNSTAGSKFAGINYDSTSALNIRIGATSSDIYGGGLTAMSILGTGNVGIGTTNPTQKLSVAGTIRAYEVIVDTGWSDYVFDESYKLKSLSETEAYIKTEKHLPGIPSAKEVAEHGVSMGEMESKLLAKIEELTLHQIEQEKHQAEQQKEIAALRQQVAELKASPANSLPR